MNEKALEKILNVFLEKVLPLTEKGVAKGSKIFGAAIIKKNDLSLVIAETNNEIENPLWHGEMHTLKKFYELDTNTRPNEKDCIFLSSHEPCSMCLSAITFSGFDNFYYMFPYAVTKNEFNIPHDLNILKEVFKINEGNKLTNFLPAITLAAILAIGMPIDLATNGTVLLALGFTSKTNN